MRNFVIGLLFWLAWLPGESVAREYYRYQNAQGQIVVVSKLNNEMIAAGYEILNEKGAVIQHVGPAKTLAEEAAEKQRILDEKKAEIARQRQIQHDADLLRQFSSLSDIIRNRDTQLLALEQRITLLATKSELLKAQLEGQQKQAAGFERAGTAVPKLVQRDIDASHTQIADNEANSIRLAQEKKAFIEQFDQDIVRFRKLDVLREHSSGQQAEEKQRMGFYNCLSKEACDTAWRSIKDYLEKQLKIKVAVQDDTLLISQRSEVEGVYNYSVSRFALGGGEEQLVLELSCSKKQLQESRCDLEALASQKDQILKFLTKN